MSDRIEVLERKVAAMKTVMDAQQQAILKLQGANDVLSKRILEEIKKANRSHLVTA